MKAMRVIEVVENKKEYLELLLLADEQEDMIDRYINKGKMFVLDDNGIKCECVITDEGNGVLEIKNIATFPEFQGKGYATEMTKAVIAFGFEKINLHKVQICTKTINAPSKRVIEKCGFNYEGTLRDYFFMDGKYVGRLYFSILRSEYKPDLD